MNHFYFEHLFSILCMSGGWCLNRNRFTSPPICPSWSTFINCHSRQNQINFYLKGVKVPNYKTVSGVILSIDLNYCHLCGRNQGMIRWQCLIFNQTKIQNVINDQSSARKWKVRSDLTWEELLTICVDTEAWW